jgi:hypothetical protein
MVVLPPKNKVATEEGYFACGRSSGYESAEFLMPKTACYDCVIELEFVYAGVKTYQCSDIRLTQMEPLPSLHKFSFDSSSPTDGVKCGSGICLNQGSCYNDNVCNCLPGYNGQFCQNRVYEGYDSLTWTSIFFLLLLVALTMLLTFGIIKQSR